jgi:hypothetical protein
MEFFESLHQVIALPLNLFFVNPKPGETKNSPKSARQSAKTMADKENGG